MKRLLIALLLLTAPIFAQPDMKAPSMQPYKVKDYSYLFGMPGFTDNALRMHFKLYQGYVKQANVLLGILQQYSNEGKVRTPQFADIKRRLMWEFDGMRLHEYYFGNLGGNKTQPDQKSALYKRIEQDFGSYDQWKTDFIAVGAMRGIGWAILYQDPESGRLINTWINEHDHGHLAGGTLLLVLDVFEHAYILDYGLDRVKYIEAFFDNINWPVVESRYPKKKDAS